MNGPTKSGRGAGVGHHDKHGYRLLADAALQFGAAHTVEQLAGQLLSKTVDLTGARRGPLVPEPEHRLLADFPALVLLGDANEVGNAFTVWNLAQREHRLLLDVRVRIVGGGADDVGFAAAAADRAVVLAERGDDHLGADLSRYAAAHLGDRRDRDRLAVSQQLVELVVDCFHGPYEVRLFPQSRTSWCGGDAFLGEVRLCRKSRTSG